MDFKEAFKLMKQGNEVKLPSWGGYWYWDANKETIMMYCKDGTVLDIRETEVVEYTTMNLLSDEWVLATEENTPILGGVATFNFGEAVKYLKRGLRVARQGWNGKNMWLVLVNPSNYSVDCVRSGSHSVLPFIGMKTADDEFVPWLASQTDILAEDYIFID